MVPEAMNAAIRVPAPNRIATPVRNSMAPAHQPSDHDSTGGIEARSGQRNRIAVPWIVNSNPKTIRNSDRTTGVAPSSLATELGVLEDAMVRMLNQFSRNDLALSSGNESVQGQ
ncbi:Uncharacterised protein [Mycobacteroides abscessus subsp. abscessus]|nr:Uncharacterised protein [Mycobacteroides abscessus subsp. abscessus]